MGNVTAKKISWDKVPDHIKATSGLHVVDVGISPPKVTKGLGHFGADPIAHLNRPAPVVAAPETSEAIASEMESAKAALTEQQAGRSTVVLTGSDEDVMQVDAEIARLKARIERCEARHAGALVREAEEAAAHEVEQKPSKALHKQAMKASAEIGQLCEQYLAKARDLAELLTEIRTREHLIREANRSLPDGVEPVPPGEPGAVHARRVGQTVFEHQPLSQRVKLPGLGGADPIFAVNYDATFINGVKQ